MKIRSVRRRAALLAVVPAVLASVLSAGVTPAHADDVRSCRDAPNFREIAGKTVDLSYRECTATWHGPDGPTNESVRLEVPLQDTAAGFSAPTISQVHVAGLTRLRNGNLDYCGLANPKTDCGEENWTTVGESIRFDSPRYRPGWYRACAQSVRSQTEDLPMDGWLCTYPVYLEPAPHQGVKRS